MPTVWRLIPDMEIKLTEFQRQSVIALTTPELDILEAAVFDVSGNQIAASPNNAIAVTNSVVPPSLDAPTNLLVNVINGTAAEITWTAPAIPANPFYTIDDISYIVNVYNLAIDGHILELDGRTTDTSYTITGLTPGESYRIVAYAVATVANHGLLEFFAHVTFNMPAADAAAQAALDAQAAADAAAQAIADAAAQAALDAQAIADAIVPATVDVTVSAAMYNSPSTSHF